MKLPISLLFIYLCNSLAAHSLQLIKAVSINIQIISKRLCNYYLVFIQKLNSNHGPQVTNSHCAEKPVWMKDDSIHEESYSHNKLKQYFSDFHPISSNCRYEQV